MAQAVQLDPDNHRAWYCLIAASEVTWGGQDPTRMQVYRGSTKMRTAVERMLREAL